MFLYTMFLCMLSIFFPCFEWCQKLDKLILIWSKQKLAKSFCKRSSCKRFIYFIFSKSDHLIRQSNEPVHKKFGNSMKTWMWSVMRYMYRYMNSWIGTRSSWEPWTGASICMNWCMELLVRYMYQYMLSWTDTNYLWVLCEPVHPSDEPVQNGHWRSQ
jgi:hypothetical protein